MKKLHLQFSGTALAVSLQAVRTICRDADAGAALLYLYLAAHEGMFDSIQTAHDLRMTADEVEGAVRSLAASGAIDRNDLEGLYDAAAQKPNPVPETRYTRAELAEAASADHTFRWLVAETESCIGRTLRNHENEKLFYLYDSVRLAPEVIPMLVRHVAEEDPRHEISFQHLLNVGQRWAERGVDSVEAVERMLVEEEERRTVYARIRNIVGIRERAPSPTEQSYINAWVEAGYSPELVERAYDITVTKTGGLNWRYASAILKRWNDKGIRTPEDVDRLEKNRNSGRQNYRNRQYYDENDRIDPEQPSFWDKLMEDNDNE